MVLVGIPIIYCNKIISIIIQYLFNTRVSLNIKKYFLSKKNPYLITYISIDLVKTRIVAHPNNN